MPHELGHLATLRAVQRAPLGVPLASERALRKAQSVGLVEFVAWPGGGWRLTAAGRERLRRVEAGESVEALEDAD